MHGRMRDRRKSYCWGRTSHIVHALLTYLALLVKIESSNKKPCHINWKGSFGVCGILLGNHEISFIEKYSCRGVTSKTMLLHSNCKRNFPRIEKGKLFIL